MMTNLSLEAAKARTASEMKRRSFWPKLARTGDKLILSHPHRGGHKARRDLATYVTKALPELRWNSKRNWWEGPLDLLPRMMDAFILAKEIQLHLSNGVKEMIGQLELCHICKQSFYPIEPGQAICSSCIKMEQEEWEAEHQNRLDHIAALAIA